MAVWSLATGKARQVSTTDWGPPTAVQYSPDGRWLAACGWDRKLHIRDAGSLRETIVLEDAQDGLASLAFNPQGTIVATGGGDPLAVSQVPMGKQSPRTDQAAAGAALGRENWSCFAVDDWPYRVGSLIAFQS